MSLAPGKQTHLLEESIWPTLMIGTPSEAATVLTLTKDCPQPPPHPPIDAGEGVGTTVLEISEPASEDRIDGLNDLLETVRIRAPHSLPERVLRCGGQIVSIRVKIAAPPRVSIAYSFTAMNRMIR